MSTRRYQPGGVPDMPPQLRVPRDSRVDHAPDWSSPTAVYMIECQAPGAYYVGVARADLLSRRLRAHWRDVYLDLSAGTAAPAPNQVFMTVHGYRTLLAVVLTGTRARAEELECEYTYALAAGARIVFGRGIEATCPGTRWLAGFGGKPWWDRNTVRGQLSTVGDPNQLDPQGRQNKEQDR